MVKSEAIPEQNDAAVVAATIADIAHLSAENGSEWREAHIRATSYINTLYNKFVPGIDERARRLGVTFGAIGLALVEHRYGRDEHHPKLYSGNYEHNVLATYHHAGHSRRFLDGMLQYAVAVNEIQPGTYDDAAFAQFPGIAVFHDSIMGNGRGNDERQSGLLAARLMPSQGFRAKAVETTVAAVDVTTWSDKLQAQSVDATKPHLEYQRAAGVGDLLSVFTKRGPYEAACLAVEDFCKHLYERVFTREARARGFSLNGVSVDECMEFMDASEVLRAKYGAFILRQGSFFANFQPADPALDDIFPGRAANVAFMNEIAAAYQSNALNAVGILAVAREYMLAP